MIILDESKLTNGTLAMIGQDYGMKLSSPTEHPEWYEQEIDMIVERFKVDVETFKERISIFLKSSIDNAFHLE